MILLDQASDDGSVFEQATVLADLLTRAGMDVHKNAHSQPEKLPGSMRFETVPYVVDPKDKVFSGLILIDANNLSHQRMAALRKLRLTDDAPVVVFGEFDDPGRQTSATAQTTYAVGRVPTVINLADRPGLHAKGSAIPCPGVPVVTQDWKMLRGRTAVQIFAPDVEAVGAGIQLTTTIRQLAALTYTSSGGKAAWLSRYGPGAHVFSYGEVLPAQLASAGRLLVLAGPVEGNYRGLAFLNTHLAAGSTIIDATPEGTYLAQGLPVLRGPADLGYLTTYLRETILPNLDGLKPSDGANDAAEKICVRALFAETGLLPPEPIKPAAVKKKSKSPPVWFMPTNGHGLGHAQRCALVAEGIREAGTECGFLAFPSCLQMIRRRGFDAVPLVSRSHLHRDEAANDQVNLARLRHALEPGQALVFDGGYVFDSVYRNIVEHNLTGIWIRRGLWTDAQDNTLPLDRERYFTRVIVPREGLSELNRPVSVSDRISEIGPVVRLLGKDFDRDALRKALSEKFEREFDTLIVTMLGSGTYIDVSTQLQLVSAFAESRPGCLNLSVVWPGSQTPPARFAWKNTEVVATQNAAMLAAAADVMVSAAGYNSFHEALYNQVPTIFVPQVAAWLDDQVARAEAASERGFAGFVSPQRPGRITRELTTFVDRGKAETVRKALAEAELPATGTADAARLITEVIA